MRLNVLPEPSHLITQLHHLVTSRIDVATSSFLYPIAQLHYLDMSRNADTSSFLDQSSLLTQLDHSSDNAKV